MAWLFSGKQNNDARLEPVSLDRVGKAASLAGAAARILQPLLATPSPKKGTSAALCVGQEPVGMSLRELPPPPAADLPPEKPF